MLGWIPAAPFAWASVLRAGLPLLVVLAAGVAVRAHFAARLDPFEDGYQHWWISANLLLTGEYWDRHSMMTQGNWLPLYHFLSAGVLAATGLYNLAAMKSVNIGLSLLTAGLVFWVGWRRNLAVGIVATAFLAFNFIDVVISGWSTAESLATLLVFLGYAALFRADATQAKFTWIAAAAFGLAVLARYEAWLVVAVVVLFALTRVKEFRRRKEMLLALLPALALMVGYSVYALQWGLLPQLVVQQTSADLAFQMSIGTQRAPGDILASWWQGYFLYFPPVILLGGGFAVLRAKSEVGSWIVFALWGFILLYAALQFGNPSYRYVLITVPFLSLFAAEALELIARRAFAVRPRRTRWQSLAVPVSLAVSAVFIVATLLPPAARFWDSDFQASVYMIPLRRAGEFLADRPLPQGKILVSESSIAAYYSGYPPDRVLGSRWLPDARGPALDFLKGHAAYIVYMGVPYYRLRGLFPELQDGTDTPDFDLLFDAGGLALGTHAVYVYEVKP